MRVYAIEGEVHGRRRRGELSEGRVVDGTQFDGRGRGDTDFSWSQFGQVNDRRSQSIYRHP